MAKANLMRLKSLETPPATFGPFVDPTQPEEPLTMELKALSGGGYYRLSARRAELVRTYITGEGMPGGKPIEFAVGSPPHIPQLSEPLLEHVALLDIMQAPANEADRCDVQELVAINDGMPYAWAELIRFAQDLNSKRFEAKKKDGSLEDGAISLPSAPESITSTPETLSEPTLSSLESTTGSES